VQTLHEVHISLTNAASIVHLIVLVPCNVSLRGQQGDGLGSMTNIRDVYLEGSGFKPLTLRLIIWTKVWARSASIPSRAKARHVYGVANTDKQHT